MNTHHTKPVLGQVPEWCHPSVSPHRISAVFFYRCLLCATQAFLTALHPQLIVKCWIETRVTWSIQKYNRVLKVWFNLHLTVSSRQSLYMGSFVSLNKIKSNCTEAFEIHFKNYFKPATPHSEFRMYHDLARETMAIYTRYNIKTWMSHFVCL